MFRKLILTGVALAAAYVVVQSVPDVRRYLRIRAM
jgi:hypothetical protein